MSLLAKTFRREACSIRTKTDKKDLKELIMIRKAQAGDELAIDYLILNYMAQVRGVCKTLYIRGAEYDDMIQEGLIGLYKAIIDYDETKEASFKTYADICIRHSVLDAVRKSLRKKHSPLNNYVSINKDDEAEGILDNSPASKIDNPEDIFIFEERMDNIISMIDNILTDFERDVLVEYINGKPYREIAGKIGISPKSVDNAIQRVKKKLERRIK